VGKQRTSTCVRHQVEGSARRLDWWLSNENTRKRTWCEMRAVHKFRCPDRLGVLASISGLITQRGGNMYSFDLHVDTDAEDEPMFMSRAEFTFDPETWPMEQVSQEFRQLGWSWNARESKVHVPGLENQLRVGLLFSSQQHCLNEVVQRWDAGELRCEIPCAVSNHALPAQNPIHRMFERHQVKFHHIQQHGQDEEDEMLEAVKETDILVLARYMRVLSPRFLEGYGKDIINIHHGLLPSFKGANPYKQAYQKGVKIIGATAHFVTEELDEGPIIEQLVERVGHRDSLASFAFRSRALERQCLFNALKYYLDHRIMRYSMNRVAVLN